jgi:hypothetical protein
MGNIISQQSSIYKIQLNKTNINVYGEASGERFYDGPFLFNCLIERDDQQYPSDEYGLDTAQNITFSFLRDDLLDANVLIEIGDIVLYQEKYYEINSVISNQYFLGKNPDYPNSPNPLNPGLENFGNNMSVVCKCHYIPADKLSLSPVKERF